MRFLERSKFANILTKRSPTKVNFYTPKLKPVDVTDISIYLNQKLLLEGSTS